MVISGFANSAPNRRSHELRRISAPRDRFRASWRRGQCSAAARCSRADGRGVPPGVQPLAAPADPFSETFAPEPGFASQAVAFSRNVAHGPCCRNFLGCTFDDGLVRHHNFPATQRGREYDRDSGREGMPSFSADRIGSSSGVLWVVVSEAGAFKPGSGCPSPE